MTSRERVVAVVRSVLCGDDSNVEILRDKEVKRLADALMREFHIDEHEWCHHELKHGGCVMAVKSGEPLRCHKLGCDERKEAE